MQRQIPRRASRVSADAITEAISLPLNEDSLYRVRTNTSVRRYNSGVALEPTRIKEELQSGKSLASFSFWMIAIGLILMSFVFAVVIVSWVVPAITKWHDDQTYGFPRTIHAKANVGHGGISDFTGLNLNGYLYTHGSLIFWSNPLTKPNAIAEYLSFSHEQTGLCVGFIRN